MNLPGSDGDADDWLALGRAVLQAQPYSVWIGARLEHLAPGVAELRLALRPSHRQQGGHAHGGVIAYLADNALAFAGGSLLGADVVTAGYSVQFTRPACGATLVARAQVVHGGRSQAVCRCDVHVIDDAGHAQLCATALGTIARSGPR